VYYNYVFEDATWGFISDSMVQAIGVSSEDYILGGVEKAVTYLHPDDTIILENHLQHMLDNQLEKNYDSYIEYRMMHQVTGEWRWFGDDRHVIFDDKGEPVSLFGNSIDITDKKKSDDALKESNDKLLYHLENTPIGSIVWDSNFKVVEWNPAAEGIFGYTKEEALGRSAEDLIIPENMKPHITDIWDALLNKTGGTYSENDNINIEGETIVCDWFNTPLVDSEGVVYGVASFVTDITQRKELEQRIAERTADLQHIISGAHCLLWHAYVEDHGTHLHWDAHTVNEEKAMEVFPIKRAPGQSHNDAIKEQRHPEDSQGMDQIAEETLRSGRSFYAQDYRCMGNDGQWHHLHEEVHIDEVAPKRWRLGGICTNISDRVRMEEEMRKNQSLESLGVLAGGIAHDFNNVLTGVIGSLALLEMLVDKDSDAYQIAVDGKRAADRTRDLTQQLLTFAKGGTPVKEVASIEALIRETTTLSLHGSNIKPEYHLAENLHSVNVDQGQIGQVIQNLILNADQAMQEGGILKVLAENVELSTQDPFPIAAGDYVKVSVVDQGLGMSEKVMAKIFDPYFSTKTTGHGLGLSITHSIIQKHDGHIAVHSEPNVGTTFEFYLPALQELAPTTTVDQRELMHGTGRILLMDDEELIHTAVGAMLEALGYEVESAYDGVAVFQAYKAAQEKAQPFDMVIMDLTISGGMGGQEAVGKLLKIDPQAQIIASSGYAHDPIMTQFSEYGFVGAVKKPVDIQELAETVNRVLADET